MLLRGVCLLFSFFLFSISLSAQTAAQRLRQQQAIRKLEVKGKGISHANFFTNYQTVLGTSKYDQWQQIGDWTDATAFRRSKFQQYHRGLPVVGAVYTLHSQGENVFRATGRIAPLLDILPQATLPLNALLHSATDQLQESLIQEERIPVHKNLQWEIGEPKLVIIDRKFPQRSGDYILAYAVELESHFQIPIIETAYFDAQNGQLIQHLSKVKSEAVPARGTTLYYGEQSFVTDSLGPQEYHLHDRSRGMGIHTFNSSPDASSQEFVDADNFWESSEDNYQNRVATDAHYCSTAYFDFMLDQFDWEGVDGDGMILNTYVNVGGRFFTNAYWNGVGAHFGNGDCDRFNPLTTLDVVGHEFAHGFTEFTSGLIYRNQSGALNESISDILGKALEATYDSEEFNWKLPSKALKDPNGRAFRSIEDPNVYNDPKYLGGRFWQYGSSDFGGVHSNSGVLNYWFYLLTEGGTGTTELGDAFTVGALGMEAALQVVFTMQVAYLTPDATYYDAFEASLSAAEDLYGLHSEAYNTIVEAWKAVGITAGHLNLDLSIEVEENTVSLCPDSEHSIAFQLQNVGLQEYPAGDTLNFRLVQGATVLQEKTYILDQNLPVGESIRLELDNFLMIGSQIAFLTVHMDCSNPNKINDRSTLFAFSSSRSGVDLALTEFEPVYNRTCLEVGATFFRFILDIKGCEGFPAGDTISFEIETPDEIFWVDYVNALHRPPNQFTAGILNIPSGMGNLNYSQYTVSIRYAKDNETSNDMVSDGRSRLNVIGDGFFEDFSGEWPSPYLSVYSPNGLVRDSVIEINGNRLLALAGLQAQASFKNCPTASDFFDASPATSQIDLCIDAQGMEAPVLALSTQQLLNTINPPEVNDQAYQVMIRMYTDSIGYDSPVIYGQSSAAFKEHEFPLPANYQGGILFEVLTLSGFSEVLRKPYNFVADILLIDNIRLFDRREDPQQYSSNGFLVYPNPVNDLLFLKSEANDRNFDLKIYDSVGRLVAEEDGVQHQSWYDTSNYAPGLYFIAISESGELTEKLKFVVTR